ncbi:efflux RND transporter periplasmic adaptor subunit [Stenotrophomonas maltophilia]|uniref:Efflux RND transporter periplasmic adaptor subunit n=2 Tax=Stenotrophomonas maltophilia TaxID=40324 RepID=A0AAJ2TQB3_STEMA|nr:MULTISPECIES: efflux RND transporter periplasmic adaptor subunit [Stenotrophomonas]EKU9957793.1 efflux RND transporter periplasmic adaptor subunit [Stenotrophomonas maltophilia]EKU9983572.1 efflux RND transporter periplasmic adaptor subunit [Stenotrophomonas maltophilia]MBA0361999.1 efflux RND transporter periplasmic adaptor subunit [Stenotrophomonas maltophilia]MBH1549872.1 efflux RND transporter periplasmic adaptor subunit [Stenotrophomonas maltophilia]MBH1620274.1 efflux RND transporter 
MKRNTPSVNTLGMLGVAALALGAGFGIARLSQSSSAPAPADAAPTAAEDNGGVQVVAIPDAYLGAAGIAVEAVTSADVAANIGAAGSVVAIPGGEAVVVSRAAGNVTEVLRQVGDKVAKGDVLARVASPDGARIAADLRVANAGLSLAQKNASRDQSLLAQGVLARQEAEASQAAYLSAQAEAQRAALVARTANVDGGGSVSVVSPIAGTISSSQATLGVFVEPQATLYRVTGSNGVEVQASVRAGDTSRIRSGDPATIVRSDGTVVSGKVRSVATAVGGLTRAATVVITPENAGAGLVVGDGVQVRLVASAGQSGGMSVPEEAVQNIDGKDVLFVRTEKGFNAQPVFVGVRSGGMAQILSGVSAGTRVATRNAFLVKAEMNKSGGDE